MLDEDGASVHAGAWAPFPALGTGAAMIPGHRSRVQPMEESARGRASGRLRFRFCHAISPSRHSTGHAD